MDMVNSAQWNCREAEDISPDEAMFETMMLGLRTSEGVAEADFQALHGISLQQRYGEKLCSLQRRGLIIHKKGRVFLTRRGMDIQNSILV